MTVIETSCNKKLHKLLMIDNQSIKNNHLTLSQFFKSKPSEMCCKPADSYFKMSGKITPDGRMGDKDLLEISALKSLLLIN